MAVLTNNKMKQIKYSSARPNRMWHKVWYNVGKNSKKVPLSTSPFGDVSGAEQWPHPPARRSGSAGWRGMAPRARTDMVFKLSRLMPGGRVINGTEKNQCHLFNCLYKLHWLETFLSRGLNNRSVPCPVSVNLSRNLRDNFQLSCPFELKPRLSFF